MLSHVEVRAAEPSRAQPDSQPARWIGEDDVVALVSLPEVIAAIRGAYLRAAGAEIVAMPKTYASWDGGTMHAVGAVATASGLAVSKTWAHTGGGATPLLAAWDVATGRLLAVIQAFALGQLRTSAISGTATSALAAQRCEVLAVIGSGKQAEGQIAAVAAVRGIQQIAIYSPTAEHRTAFAGQDCRALGHLDHRGRLRRGGGGSGRRDHHGDARDRTIPARVDARRSGTHQRRWRDHARTRRARARRGGPRPPDRGR